MRAIPKVYPPVPRATRATFYHHVLHQQQSSEIENEAYRAACYAQLGITSQRQLFALCMQPERG